MATPWVDVVIARLRAASNGGDGAQLALLPLLTHVAEHRELLLAWGPERLASVLAGIVGTDWRQLRPLLNGQMTQGEEGWPEIRERTLWVDALLEVSAKAAAARLLSELEAVCG